MPLSRSALFRAEIINEMSSRVPGKNLTHLRIKTEKLYLTLAFITTGSHYRWKEIPWKLERAWRERNQGVEDKMEFVPRIDRAIARLSAVALM